MAARICPECGGLVASTISRCPHCGYILEGPFGSAESCNAQNCGVNPYNSIGWSIVSLLLFWPCGIASLIYYFKSDNRWQAGDGATAEQYGRSSVRWAKASLWILLFPALYLIFLSAFVCHAS